ncbi:CYFA0S04e00584g1_1 [Cyberlindnera fabianii]|uniref:Pre-mRNA-splicing factor CEF1 n=1 Tax=Cyberlindnera fabianii TaxID=36022 RepID=A0A061AX13_CYBFA|nr:CYFA0S04e00584g1_1 [Cyberlindnera fabianii]
MVPVYIKGGAWSNTEDEVLKAAVSKYGLNQWARVSTLLPKKTSKQCRARWQEYLDPRIRKSDWSREEDEKLLRLARLMPNQWRSISSTLGRTATQCVERYQKLLDEASGVESSNDLGLSGLGSEALKAVGASSSETGDFNLNAEHKEAIPDAVDLDDDEKEMLSEARARLANTKGKKATRKARERMLEESKRIALLQKRRELKQAGITTKLKAPKKKFATQFDYNADIPFEHRPTGGFYDTVEETGSNDQALREFQRKVDKSGVKDDKAREKRPRNDKIQTTIEKEAKPQDEDSLFKKRKLELPEPEFKEDDLSKLSKLDDSELETALKERANAVGSNIDDRIKDAAQRIREEKRIQSALLITEEGEGEEDEASQTADSDEVHDQFAPTSGETDVKTSIRDRLAALPKPKNDFELIDEDEEDVEFGETEDVDGMSKTVVSTSIPEDEGEKERLRAVKAEQERKNALKRRSQAVQKGLLVPSVEPGTKLSVLNADDDVQKLVDKELVKLIRSDHSKLNHTTNIPIVADLDEASRKLVAAEIEQEINMDDLAAFKTAFTKIHETSYVLNVDPVVLVSELQSLVESSNKLEKALAKQINGYVKRNEALTEQSIKDLHELKDVDRVLAAMEMLRDGELGSANTRAETLREEVDVLVQAEQRAHETYLELKRSV